MLVISSRNCIEAVLCQANYSLSQELPFFDEDSLTMHASDFAIIEYGKSSGGQFLVFGVTPVDGSDCSLSYRQWTLGGAATFNAPPPLLL